MVTQTDEEGDFVPLQRLHFALAPVTGERDLQLALSPGA